MNISLWCERVIRAGFILLFALVPLLLTPWNYELFEYNKMIATYALTVIIVGAWVIKMVSQKEIRIARTPLDIPIILFFTSQLVSALFSIDHHVSWFGYYSRFNGGMWSVISYILLYYAFVSNKLATLPLLVAALSSGAIVATYGVLERLGIDKHLWVQDVQNRVFSTLGQPNWLAAYLVALSPIAWGFALGFRKSEFRIRNYLFCGISILFFLVLLFTRSRSGLVGFAAADIAFWGLVFLSSRLSLKAPQGLAFIMLHVSFVIVVLLNGTSIDSIDHWFRPQSPSPSANVATPSGYAAPLLEYGGTESGTIRKYVWQGAITAWKSTIKTRLIGTGTETFAFAFYQYRPKEHNLTSEWDFLYNKAHNEYLNYLTTTGLFGLASYLLIIGVFIAWFLKRISEHNTFVSFALFAGWVSILVTNFFGFSVVILQLFFFLFPAMIIAEQHTLTFPLRLSESKIRLASLTLFLVFLALLVLLARMWWADVLFAKGYRGTRLGQYEQAKTTLTQAFAINPIEPLYHDEAASTLSLLTGLAIGDRNATEAAEFAREAIRQSDIALRISPNNVNYWKTRTKILYSFAPFDPTFTKAAISALETAKGLSPNDPKITYNLAVLWGQNGDNQKAIELLKTAVDLKPNYRDAYWALHIFYKETGSAQLAKSILSEYLTKVDPNDRDFAEARTQ